MDFDFSDEQKQFKDQVRKLLDRVSPLAECRRALSGAQAFSQTAWSELAKLGFQGAVIPEEYGGVGLGYLELCVAAEEIGHSLTPIPSLASVYVCTEAIRRYGSDAQKKEWLPRLSDGSAIGTWAAAEIPDEFSPHARTTFARERLTGVKTPVVDGTIAEVCVVLAHSANGIPCLVLCDLSSATAREPVGSTDPSRPLAKVTFAGAAAEPLGNGVDAVAAYRDLMNRAAVLLSFEQIGGADRALSMAREYALERYAFGRPIGANQAIKHKLADIYSKNQLARAHAYYGAWAISADAAELPLAAAGSHVAATEAFNFAAQENLQTHGGIGFTWESDCQLFYRRARFCALAIGGLKTWKEQIVSALETQNG
jgi:alkylation response protein AidB-like acyl-CoA dehydrogenase